MKNNKKYFTKHMKVKSRYKIKASKNKYSIVKKYSFSTKKLNKKKLD